MEVKARLMKPYTEAERINFIVEENHRHGYDIRETDEALEAWGITDEEDLAQARQMKYIEINEGAKRFLEEGEALFEVEEGKHVEATDGNIGKLNAYITGFTAGVIETAPWSTKEDEVIMLDAELTTKILLGLMTEQTRVWVEKVPYYLNLVEEAKTADEVRAIHVDFHDEAIAEIKESIEE